MSHRAGRRRRPGGGRPRWEWLGGQSAQPGRGRGCSTRRYTQAARVLWRGGVAHYHVGIDPMACLGGTGGSEDWQTATQQCRGSPGAGCCGLKASGPPITACQHYQTHKALIVAPCIVHGDTHSVHTQQVGESTTGEEVVVVALTAPPSTSLDSSSRRCTTAASPCSSGCSRGRTSGRSATSAAAAGDEAAALPRWPATAGVGGAGPAVGRHSQPGAAGVRPCGCTARRAALVRQARER